MATRKKGPPRAKSVAGVLTVFLFGRVIDPPPDNLFDLFISGWNLRVECYACGFWHNLCPGRLFLERMASGRSVMLEDLPAVMSCNSCYSKGGAILSATDGPTDRAGDRRMGGKKRLRGRH